VAKREFPEWMIEGIQSTEEGRMYLKYNEIIGGKRIGLTIPSGYPKGVLEMGGEIKVYEECIKRGITWEELLNYKEPPEGVEF